MSANYDVVIVGAGCAGLTAAIGLARSGFAVAVVEAAAYPGAENWSGCVYFTENLAHPEILGPDGVEPLAWERRLVERGLFATDGHGLLGMTYRDPKAFRHCYTVLRPVFDHHIAMVAIRHGVALLSETTAESLIRDGGRVVGVSTNRGPLYGDLVFLAEGDASHLVSREGYEKFTDPREQPKFLQGIKQVIELPPGAVEEIFKLGAEEGAAYELLLRNGTLRGRPVRLNMGGFVYTNKESLSVGLVLPADNLRDHFGGDPNLLMEWFETLPALQPWLKLGTRGAFGAKLIRGGGAREIPRLIDDGLAIGGAASGIGIDFPYPNFTGPATGMGLLLAQAARQIRAEKGRFTQDELRRHYLEPLQKTHYWRDVEFLRRWPSYVKRTTVFFDRNLDLALGTAYVWTRPDRWLPAKWFHWLRLLWRSAGPNHWPEMKGDLRHLGRALHFKEVVGRPGFLRLLLDGTINAIRDLLGRPRAHVPPGGEVQLHFTVAGGAEQIGPPPGWARRWFRRFANVLGPAARRVYANDTEPLESKLIGASGLMVRQVNLFDLLAAGTVGLSAGVGSALLAGWDRLIGLIRKSKRRGLAQQYAEAARQTADLTPLVQPAAQHWEGRLGQLSYQTAKESHIQLLWPRDLAKKNAVVANGLWHVCPAHVYEARPQADGQVQVVVNYENCIKCETCWRTTDLVDWGRDGKQQFIYPVRTSAAVKLAAAAQAAGLARPAQPLALDWWGPAIKDLADQLRVERPGVRNGQNGLDLAELTSLADKLERKLEEFEQGRAKEPRTVDRSRAEYLEMVARSAQQLAARFVEVLRGSPLGEGSHASIRAAHHQLLEVGTTLAAKAEDLARRAREQKFSWAAADGRQIRQHHLVGLRRVLQVMSKFVVGPTTVPDPARDWLQAEEDAVEVAETAVKWRRQLDAVFPAAAWKEIDQGTPLSPEQDALLRSLIAQVPPIDPHNLTITLHPPVRKFLLAELGRRDPSLAYRVAAHLWARDLARLAGGTSAAGLATSRWQRGEEWACFTAVDGTATPGGWQGEALFVPAGSAHSLLLLLSNRLIVVPAVAGRQPGLVVEPVPTLGLRGAGLARVRLDRFTTPPDAAAVDPERLRRAWSVLSAADLIAIARGMADVLCRRAIAHATSRVQFPGLFHDEQARDPIGKFGAVKQMVAEMGARRYLIETLDHVLSPVDFSAASAESAGLAKLVVAEALGTAPGSLSYNAGQIFGGTGYSEDDILAKLYRDAAAWRFLEPADSEVARRHGNELLRTWRPDGQRLAALAGEAELFEQLARRKALQAELDEVRVFRSHLRGLVNEWQAALEPFEGQQFAFGPKAQAEMAEGLGRQDALLLASKALLLRTHARLEYGVPSEVELALVRVWLDDAARELAEFESLLRLHFHLGGKRAEQPVVEPGVVRPITGYREFLAATAPYNSGDFLLNPVDLSQPRFVPEMIEADPWLAAKAKEFRDQLLGQFGAPRNGLIYERHIEQKHRPDAEDLDFCRQTGYFRMMIPEELGGAGRPKIDYYLLTSNAQRLTDVALSLTIQVNTSIGTTPVLLARDKDLPRAQKEMVMFVGDPAVREEVGEMLGDLIERAATDRFELIQQSYQLLHERLEATVLGSGALRALQHQFLEAWTEAGKRGKEFDRAGLRQHLEEAQRRWKEASSKAEEYHQELARRKQACELFLRWVASGQISAFALTEPSAGSDTARVATRAKLMSVPVLIEADGVLSFVPDGRKDRRHLLDARRLEFKNDPTWPGGFRAFYRWSDKAEPSPIRFEEYDYETDNREKMRWYDHGGRKVHFADVAQLRERDGRYLYDYWELTGAKMWITNGRQCGIMALYAKTEEGITGFIVDRHAEGLVVGKDEEKLGQNGSPTNELSLQAVRVPRENVLGVEGRGQVNALETLNVGRAGLAMSFGAQIQGLIDQSRAYALSAFPGGQESTRGQDAESRGQDAGMGEVPDWVGWRLELMEEERFVSESLAHEIVGRFEHKQTKSVRMESSIAKMLVSESLHRVIELAEEVHGLAGQTQAHLVEKRKRDARVLNIYEGTNEVQRFLVLKDLAGLEEGRKPEDKPTRHASPEALDLDRARLGLRQRVRAALEGFGQQLWQNPNLQPCGFLLSEAAAWLKSADSVLGRLAWLQEAGIRSQESGVRSQESVVGVRAFHRCLAEVRERLRRFDARLIQLRRGSYAPVIRAACLLFDWHEGDEAKEPLPASLVGHPLSVLVVLEPAPASLPHPHVRDGKRIEAFWTLGEGDRAALETALRLRDAADAAVSIQVAAVGPRAAAPALREALARGVDRARLILPEVDAVTPDCAAAALATVIRTGPKFDLVLGGGSAGGEEGMIAKLTAEALGVPHAGTASFLAVRTSGGEGEAILVRDERRRSVALPAAVSLAAGLPLRPATVEVQLAALAKAVEAERWPRRVIARSVQFAEADRGEAAEAPEAATGPLTPAEAASQLSEELGLRVAAASGRPFEGSIDDVPGPEVLAGGVLALLAADGEGRLQSATALTTTRAARLLGELDARDAAVVLLVPPDDQAQRRALAQLRQGYRGDVLLLATSAAGSSPEILNRLVEEVAGLLSFRTLVAEPWAEPALVRLGGRRLPGAVVATAVRGLNFAGDHIVLQTVRGRGKVAARQLLPAGSDAPCFVTLAAEAQLSDNRSVVASRLKPFRPGSVTDGRVWRWAPRLDGFFGRADVRLLLDEVRAETGLARLADADFIIDVGFGVGNRDGYEEVIDPLEQALRSLGVRNVVVGGSRKVTEELHLLPADRQIGQSGVNVNPRILLAIGVSGAPQHLDYIGARATILAFNRDPEAPLMTLNRRRPRPRVFPVVGDLFETVPALIAALRHEEPAAEEEVPAAAKPRR